MNLAELKKPFDPADMIGQTFGRLTVISDANMIRNQKRYWECKCICGNTISVPTGALRSGNTTSCGCKRSETHKGMVGNKRPSYKHGGKHTRLYRIWRGMMTRCYLRDGHAWKWYGAKGISVTDEWRNFEGFRSWAFSSGYVDNLSIDRIDPNGNYEPHNCRWITIGENSGRANKGKRGDKSPLSKISDSDIESVRKLRKEGLTYRRIGKMFGVGISTIHRIVKNKRGSSNESINA